MKKILVPTDFSKCADNAVEFAVQTAKIMPLEITLLHAYELNNSLYTDYVGLDKEFNLTLLNDAKKKLTALKKSIEESHGIIMDTVLSTDPLQAALKTLSQTKQSDLIVMGTQGASGIKEKLFGSRTATTISKAKMPVMAIPTDYHWKKPQKILLVTNQYEKDPAILNYIFELADLYMANMQVAVFIDEEKDNAGILLENKRKMAEYEHFLKETYKEETLTSALFYGEQFEETLRHYLKENEIDMLIMVTYDHKFWFRVFNPSKTKQMSYQIQIPLLAIPARER